MPITELRIEGLRTLGKIRLELNGLTVLIGDNGTGKSSILEACEILRRVTGRSFMDELYGIHGGLTALLKHGAPHLIIGVTIKLSQNDFDPQTHIYNRVSEAMERFESIEYDLAIVPSSEFATLEETIRISPVKALSRKMKGHKEGTSEDGEAPAANGSVVILRREASECNTPAIKQLRIDRSSYSIDGRLPFFVNVPEDEAIVGSPFSEGQIIVAYLRRLRVHIPFETMPAWASRALDRKSALRTSALLTPATQLEKLGVNLASAYHALKNSFGRSHWDDTLAYIRLGLGERIEDVVTWADPSGGNIGLSIKMVGLDVPISAAQLSDGMLSYLAFVAMFRLHVTKPSLLAFDEPDLHLHPHLLMRVLDFFEAMARDTPVLLATHSDRLLDGLTDPAKSVVLCDLDERGTTRLVRPDREALARWLERYRGLGDIRSAGHVASVMTKVEPS